jgi:hypothetical protein
MHNANALEDIVLKDGGATMQFNPIGNAGRQLPRDQRADADIDWAQVARELAELPPLVNQSPSSTFGKAEASQPNERVCFADFLRLAIRNLMPLIEDTGREVELELVEPPHTLYLGEDIREALRSLFETSLLAGAGPVRVCGRAERVAVDRARVVIEVLSDALDVPDKVRRKLTKAVNAQSGETSFRTALRGSGVRIRIPIDTVDAPSALCPV